MADPCCFHCGDPCDSDAVQFNGELFCCTGCKTVYGLLKSHNLDYYYELEGSPGYSPQRLAETYDYLDDPAIAGRLLEFQDDSHQVVNLQIPQIHCSSCIWILENLHRLNPGILSSQVDFPRREARIHFNPERIDLRGVVGLLGEIGYEPSITLENYTADRPGKDRKLIYQLGVAGFAFGNIMFLSFPEYFESGEFWLERYKLLFRWLMFAFSLPVVLYSAQDYLIAAYKGLRSGILNIDVPIALGILVLFLRSTAEVALDLGSGFFDSLSGLVFFLLLGRFFQQRTYAFLSFERDYRSYFPIAVTRLGVDGEEKEVPVYDVIPGDRLLIRNQGLIPADSILLSGIGDIDYSFVTGEARPVQKAIGDQLYAGGKQLRGAIEIEVLKPASQSYLTELWSDPAFAKEGRGSFRNLTDRVGSRFTPAVLAIAIVAASVWMWIDPSRALNVFTAVLIIACPCAIALAAPFTLGNLLRLFGRQGFYVKDTETLERMAQSETIIFDKTGTISSARENRIDYSGLDLAPSETAVLRNVLRASGHPLSQALYRELAPYNIVPLDYFEEIPGKGIEGRYGEQQIRVGSRGFIGLGATDGDIAPEKNMPEGSIAESGATGASHTPENPGSAGGTEVHISANDDYKGCYTIRNAYRNGAAGLFERLGRDYRLAVLSGDNASEKQALEAILPPLTPAYFNKQPREKLHFVRELQQEGRQVIMVGDGLNDAGALCQAHAGIAVSEDANLFTPACDAILDSRRFADLDRFLGVTRRAMGVVKLSFALSLIYNLAGLYFAVTGRLEPVIAAILMPLSSISIVAFTTVATNWIGRKLKPSDAQLHLKMPAP